MLPPFVVPTVVFTCAAGFVNQFTTRVGPASAAGPPSCGPPAPDVCEPPFADPAVAFAPPALPDGAPLAPLEPVFAPPASAPGELEPDEHPARLTSSNEKSSISDRRRSLRRRVATTDANASHANPPGTPDDDAEPAARQLQPFEAPV